MALCDRPMDGGHRTLHVSNKAKLARVQADFLGRRAWHAPRIGLGGCFARQGRPGMTGRPPDQRLPSRNATAISVSTLLKSQKLFSAVRRRLGFGGKCAGRAGSDRLVAPRLRNSSYQKRGLK